MVLQNADSITTRAVPMTNLVDEGGNTEQFTPPGTSVEARSRKAGCGGLDGIGTGAGEMVKVMPVRLDTEKGEESTDRSNYSARDATFVCAFVLVKRLTDSGISWFSARM
ncbi:hypothetical protein VTN49DRAFT_4334 [Thermomyces lanuginosus]|uniref:uncharacterized protein n=1 Tax=Thermomyces lanuginosus TaxID=5541 RepID=UPI003743CC85